MAVQTDLLTKNERQFARELLGDEVTRKAYIDTTVTPLTSADTYRLFYYEAHTLINEVMIITDVAEGAAETIDILDDEAATTTLLNDTSLNTAHTMTKYTTGFFKATAGYISILANAAITAAKFWVIAKTIKVETTD